MPEPVVSVLYHHIGRSNGNDVEDLKQSIEAFVNDLVRRDEIDPGYFVGNYFANPPSWEFS